MIRPLIITFELVCIFFKLLSHEQKYNRMGFSEF